MKLFVEGGGDGKTLRTACREGFSEFLRRAGVERMPKIVACGGRQQAFDDFCFALENGEPALLLVDSEAPVVAEAQRGDASSQDSREKWRPWLHLRQRRGDEWEKPAGAEDVHCHLMVQCTESWLLADRRALTSFFGEGFKERQLPAEGNRIERIAKSDMYKALAEATKDCKTKAKYGKGEHSFKLLALIDPVKVMDASPWARRFVENIKTEMQK